MSALKKLTLAASAVALSFSAMAASAQTTNLRIQTHFSQETLSGQMAGTFVENVTAMSNGEIQIEMFYGGTVVKSAEIWDAATTGVLDCDMSGASYQSGKNPAFQFANDLNGGYQDPYQMYSWLMHGDGYNTLNELYNAYGMEFVGWWIPGPESLTSTSPLRGTEDLKDWKFRSPPGIISMIFSNLGASPIVMDFN
ncbi:MAG: C4-dicarboxylate ABC transporter substrate-binding protein, partial [Arenibacterium sp.]